MKIKSYKTSEELFRQIDIYVVKGKLNHFEAVMKILEETDIEMDALVRKIRTNSSLCKEIEKVCTTLRLLK